MTTPYDTIKSAILGNPVDPNKKPDRTGVVRAFQELQLVVDGAQAGALVFGTLAQLTATTVVPSANIMAWVYGDPIVANNGVYRNTGTALAAVWTRVGNTPQYLVSGINVGAGTANAIKITTDLPFATEDGRSMLLIPIIADSTASPITVQVNDNTPYTLKTNVGSDLPATSLKNGMVVAAFKSGNTLRMLMDLDNSAVQAIAEEALNTANDALTAADEKLAKNANLSDLTDVSAARMALGLGSAALRIANDAAAITDDVLRSSSWFYTDVRDAGAVTGTGAVQDVAFTDAKAKSATIKLHSGNWRLTDGYNLGTDKIWEFDHNAKLVNGAGAPSTAGIGYLQVMGYLNDNFVRSVRGGRVTAPNIKIGKDDTLLSAGGDETVMDERVFWYDRAVGASGNAYLGGLTIFTGFINAGMIAPVGGAIGVYQARINVGDTESGVAGRHEHIAFSAGIICDPAKTQNVWNGYVLDLVIASPTLIQESFMAGWTVGIKKLNGFQTLDANHDGTYGGTVETSPFMGGYAAPFATTYPMNVGLAVSGWSGPTTATSGNHADATAGWQWAFFAGGNNGQWNPFGTISKIDHGMGITDYVFSGIEIFTAHPHATDPFAIRVLEDGGKSSFGINTPSGNHKVHIGNGSAQFDMGLKLYETSHATSKRTGIDFNGQASIMLDTAGTGIADFGLFMNAISGFPLIINDSGKTTLGVANATATGDVLTVNNTTEQLAINIKLQPSGHASSDRTTISFNNLFYAGTDALGNGGLNLFFSKAGQNPALQLIDADAGQAKVYMDLPTSAAGLTAGMLWRDNAASNVVKIV